MKKMWLFTVAISMIAVISVGFIVFADDTNHTNAEFLSYYGWIVDESPIEKVDVTLPLYEDDVYKAYNNLQKEAGLSLSDYYGKSGVRYTYKVLNYPKETHEVVRANVLVINDKPVAGDIMTVSSGGFMHSLIYPK